MLVLRTTMTVCLGCWYDEGADEAIADWVSSDEEPEASYDGDPHEREADQDPPKPPEDHHPTDVGDAIIDGSLLCASFML